MRDLIKGLVVLTAVVFMFGIAQGLMADEMELPVASGVVIAADPESSTIVIDDVNTGEVLAIGGFAFGYLERRLEEELYTDDDIVIAKDDCVTVTYVELRKNIAVALTGYEENCGQEEYDLVYEDEEGIVLRDEYLMPVPKSKEGVDRGRSGMHRRDNKNPHTRH